MCYHLMVALLVFGFDVLLLDRSNLNVRDGRFERREAFQP